MQEVAHAMCEMCLEPHHRDSEKCASFKGVTSCDDEAHEEGKLTEWATGVEELQADLRRKVEESKAHHEQLERLHPHEEPHPLLEDIALAVCQMCLEPRHRDSEKCFQYQDVSSCDAAAHQAAVSGHLFAAPPGPPAGAAEGEPLREKVDELGCELCSDPARRGREACRPFVESPACRDHLKAAAPPPDAGPRPEAHSQSWVRIDRLLRDICRDPARRDLPTCQKLLEPAWQPASTGPGSSEGAVAGAREEWCRDPAHHHLAACKLVLHEAWEPSDHAHAHGHAHGAELRRKAHEHMAEEERQVRALRAKHVEWDAAARDRMSDLKRQLCSDPARQGYSICKDVPHPHASSAGDIAKHESEFADQMHNLQARHEEWDHAAKDQLVELRERLCADPSRRGYAACAHLHGATPAEAHADLDERMHKLHDAHDAWDHHAQEEMTSLKAQLCLDPSRRHYPACAGEHAAGQAKAAGARMDEHMHELHAKHHEWDEHARGEIGLLLDELCADPARRGYAACAEHHGGPAAAAQPPATQPAAGARDPGLDAQLREWDSHSADRAFEIGRELCADPSRRPFAACVELLRVQSTTGAATSSSSLRGGGASTEQASATSSSSSLRGSTRPPPLTFPEGGWASLASESWGMPMLWGGRNGVAVVSPKQLRREQEAQWQGKIPKVVCVTLVPDGPSTLDWLQTTVESFRAQTYEGPRELRLVYHSSHSETAELVKAVADEVLIHGLAVYGEEEFPSTAPFRFGAWKTDADLVARWDVGAWHHPDRLAAQVRAMAVVARPAVLLGGGGRPDGSHVGGQEQTLIGEVGWMKKHWYPLLGGPTLLDGPEASHMVRLDMPELYIPGPA